jgi:tetratricopeptide (TPR) repeat protein
MVGSIRPLALSMFAIILGLLGTSTRADDEPASQPEKASQAPSSLDDTPQPFVPLHPRTVEDRHRIEALEAFTAARSLEDRRQLREAVALLEEALKKDPDSLAILRSLSRLCFAIGRIEQGVESCRKVIEADPNDTTTLHRLARYYEIRNDPEGAEKLLTSVLANPKLDKKSPAFLLVEHDLGMLYKNKLKTMASTDPSFVEVLGKAADAFESVLNALDEKAANELSPADLQRILGFGSEAADSYLAFGEVLLDAKRYDPAIKAFQRGLVYKSNHPELSMKLTRALTESGKPEEALALVERLVNQHPQQREVYVLLTQILTDLKRSDEIIPRLEAAAQADPKNRAVQYALAERYLQNGQREKANNLYEKLRASPPTAQDFAALLDWLLKEKNTDELLRMLGEAAARREGQVAVRSLIVSIANDPAYAEEVLAAGLKLLEADPPALSKETRRVLAQIADRIRKPEKLVELLRLAIKRDPALQDYSDLIDTLAKMGKNDEVAATIEELLTKYPNQKNSRTLTSLALNRLIAGKKDTALEAIREARKLDPTNPDVLRSFCAVLIDIGKGDDVLATIREAQKLDPTNPVVLYTLCVILSRMGKDAEALETARGVIKTDPANVDFNRFIGSMLVQAGKNDEAITHYNSLLERFPNNDDIESMAHSSLSAIYVNMEDYAKGEAELEILLKKDPDDAGVNNDLGYLYADQGKNLEQAEAMIRKAVEADPTNFAYLDSLGWVLFKRGKIKEALSPLEKAAMDPRGGSDPTIQDHLGDIYFRLKEYTKAKSAWEQAAKIAADARPPDKRLPEIRKKLESLKELEPAPRSSQNDSP